MNTYHLPQLPSMPHAVWFWVKLRYLVVHLPFDRRSGWLFGVLLGLVARVCVVWSVQVLLLLFRIWCGTCSRIGLPERVICLQIDCWLDSMNKKSNSATCLKQK